MDHPKWGFLCLPLEIRQEIYEMSFDTSPTPGILRVNRQVHDESIQFIRERRRTFSFNISGKGAGFGDFSQWCFKIKGHTPELDRMKHLILNIYPPEQDRPIDMWHIWNHVRSFCEDLAAHKQILQLTVKFIEIDRTRWATHGKLHDKLHNTMCLPYDPEDFCSDDVGQILTTIFYFVHNVKKPRLILPRSYTGFFTSDDAAQKRVDYLQQFMTGRFEEEDVIDDYELMEYYMEEALLPIKRSTGRKSKAIFQRYYVQNAILSKYRLYELKRQWPHMDDLPDHERPRCRPTYDSDDSPPDSMVEVSMPDPAWEYLDSDRARQWHEEPWSPARLTWETMDFSWSA